MQEKPRTCVGKTIDEWIAQIMADSELGRYEAAVQFGESVPLFGESVASLIKQLDDEDVWVRWWATNTLKLLGPKAGEAVPKLLEKLDDAEFWIFWATSEALRVITRTDVPVENLTEMACDSNKTLRATARKMLQKSTKRASTRAFAKMGSNHTPLAGTPI